MRPPKLCALISLRTGSLAALGLSLIVPISQFMNESLGSAFGIASLVIHLLGLITIVGCIYAFYKSSIKEYFVSISFYVVLSVAFFILWSISLSKDYSNKDAIIERCVASSSSSGRYNLTLPELKRSCEEVLPTYLFTKTFALVIVGIITLYFDLVVTGFYLELTNDPSKYSFPWFSFASPTVAAEQVQLEVVHDPTPEYMPPLPPYREKSTDISRSAEDESHSTSDTTAEDRPNQERQQSNVFRIE